MTLRYFPPIHFNGPRFHPNDHPDVKAVRRRKLPFPTGVNVWQMNDDSFRTTQPITDEDQIKRLYKGASWHVVSEEEAALLSGAGLIGQLIDDEQEDEEEPDDEEPTPGIYSATYSEAY